MPRKYSKEELGKMSEKELSRAMGETVLGIGKSIFGGIKGIIDSNREAKEEAERQERERLERQRKAKARAKTLKIVFLVILLFVVIGVLTLLIIDGTVLQNVGSFFSGIFSND
jgi:hypothetical protein